MALEEMRLLVYHMRLLGPQETGLAEALQQRLDAVEKRAGVQAQLVTEGTVVLPGPVKEELYRIAQEALNNALKHAGAASTLVRLAQDERCVVLEVVDSGCGFDPQAVGDDGGVGLSSMRERAQRLGADLIIASAAGQGTRVTARLELAGSI